MITMPASRGFSCSVFVLYIDDIYACTTTIYRAQLTNNFKLLLKLTSLGFNCEFNIYVSLMYVSCCMCLFCLVVGSSICGIVYDYNTHTYKANAFLYKYKR